MGNFVKEAVEETDHLPRRGLAWFLHSVEVKLGSTRRAGMKAGYSEAAWRLFQPSLAVRTGRSGVLTWADMELAGTPFGRPVPLPVVRIRGDHGKRASQQRQGKI